MKWKMPEFESNDEILELAITREVEAHKFFLIMASRAATPEMRNVFEELARMELEHKAKLELEMMKAGLVVKEDEKFELESEDYEQTEIPKLNMEYKDMLLMGIQKEDASFRLYVTMAGKAKDEESFETLLALAEEELRHKLLFEREYENLLKTS
jgi:rubrerythrin